MTILGLKFIASKEHGQYVIAARRKTIFVFTYKNQFGWFRICGKGLKFKHQRHGLIFSERLGKTWYLKCFGWYIGILK